MARCTNTNASTGTDEGAVDVAVSKHTPPRARALRVALAALFAGAGLSVVGMLVATAMATIGACSYVEIRGPSDANPDPEVVHIETEDCGTRPVALCDASAPITNGCTGEPERGDASASSTIPTDVTFPLGCTVNIPSTYKTPQGECLVAYACKCTSPGARLADGGSQWTCVR